MKHNTDKSGMNRQMMASLRLNLTLQDQSGMVKMMILEITLAVVIMNMMKVVPVKTVIMTRMIIEKKTIMVRITHGGL